MQPFDSNYFFIIMFSFVLLVWILRQKCTHVHYQILFFLGTIIYTLVAFRSLATKIFLFSLFYLSIIKLASVYKHVSRKIYIICALLPLILFKISAIISVENNLHAKIGFVGISYISFRVIQILLDLDVYPTHSFMNIFTFLINPLTILAGPIDRYYRFEKNLNQLKDFLTKENLITGWYLFILGLIQKFILAYYWEIYVMNKFLSKSFLLKDIFGTAYSYTVYLFLDFSGYSLMAVGIGYMLGITFPQNFDQPWKTQNPQDLWRRFHITLGSFLNDYFFKPIYMTLMRKNFFKANRLLAQNISLFLTFMLMGAWNGLRWYYLLSGAMFGVASVVYNTYQYKFKKSQSSFLSPKLMPAYRLFFLNYVVWALYFFSGKLPV